MNEHNVETASIELRSVTKTFGPEVRAVDNISLTIEPGSLVTLLGPSGSGKTTILRAIAGFEDITSGEILIDGESISYVPTHRRRLGMVAQDYALFPHMTVKENLAFGIRSSHRARRDTQRLTDAGINTRISEMLEIVGLGGYGDRRPQQLSGGQKQRVALARALVTQPRVLLLDEPFAALDKHLREQLQVEVRRVQQQVGITTVFVTHDQGEALSMSDKIAVLNHGQLQQYAEPREVYDAPLTRFVAEFIGRTNLLPATVVNSTDTDAVVALTGGETLSVATVRSVSTGSPVHVSVRPERLQLSHAAADTKATGNRLAGTVVSTVYLGDRIDVTVDTPAGAVTANVPRIEHGDGEFAVGDTVVASFSSRAAAIVPDAA